MITKFGNLTLRLKGELTPDEAEELEHDVNVPIYWNDIDSQHWCFDYRMKSGRWIENIMLNNELTEVTAAVYGG